MTDFIHQEYIDNLDLCDEIIKTFDECTDDNKFQAFVNVAGKNIVDTNIKDCIQTDLNFFPEVFKPYIECLKKVLDSYMKEYPRCYVEPFSLREQINIQYYKPNAAFKSWHCERSSVQLPIFDRHLVFMTYLNDVTDGGETEFYHQKLLVKPKKGLTLIWPAEWTHTHRGIVSPTQEKYIVTGWFSFIK